jgi:ABC-type nitrate/sulfonate/bicarbonate transport system substrate-binding protein
MTDRRSFTVALGAALACFASLALSGTAVAQASLGTIKVIIATAPPDPFSHYFYYARENGYYKEAGLEVELQPVNSDPTTVRALVAGEGDVGWAGAQSSLQAIAAGSKLKVLSAFTPKLDYLVVANKAVANLKGFDGRPFAVSQVGAISQLAPKMMIERAGGDSSKVQWLSVGGSSSRVQALIAKRVEGAALNSAFAARAVKYDYLHVIGDAVSELPNFIYAWEIASEAALQKKKPAVQAFVTQTARAARWAMQNPAGAAAISRKVTPDSPAEDIEIATGAVAKKQVLSPTGHLAREAWDFTVGTMVKAGDLPKALAYEDIVVTEFVDAAGKALGPYPK